MTRPHPWLEKKTHLHPSWASLFLFVCPSLLISFFLTCSNVAFFVCSILEAVKRADWCFVKSTDIHWAVRVTDGGFRAKARCRHSWRANPSVAVLHVANVNPPYDFITLCVHSLSLFGFLFVGCCGYSHLSPTTTWVDATSSFALTISAGAAHPPVFLVY